MGGGREGLVQLTSSAGTFVHLRAPVCSHDPLYIEKRSDSVNGLGVGALASGHGSLWTHFLG